MQNNNAIQLNSKYKPLFANDKRYHIISGGRASGKSYTVAFYLLLLTFEYGNVILFSRYTMTSVHISVYPEFIDKLNYLGLEDHFLVTKDEIINKGTGSRIIFKGIKAGSNIQTANLKSIANLNVVVIDEAEEIPSEDIFDKIDLSCRRKDKYNKIILVFNPTNKTSWIYKRFYQDKGIMPAQCIQTTDTNYIHTTYLDNKEYLSDSILTQIEAIRTNNPTKYNHVILGAFLDAAEGLIYSQWKLGEFNEELPWGLAIDWGYSPDETAIVRVALDKKNKKIYLDEIAYSTKLGLDDIYTILAPYGNRVEIVAEYAGQGSLVNDELRKKGLNVVNAVKGPNSVMDGIKLIQDYELIVTPSSKNIVSELNNYCWNNQKAGIPQDLNNHCCDAFRYYVTKQIIRPVVSKYMIR